MAKDADVKKKVEEAGKTKSTEYVEISRRERYLREKLLTIDEDAIHDERRIRRNSEHQKAKITSQINRVRERQEAKLDRLDSSKIYQRSRIGYAILSPFFAIGRGVRGIYRKLSGRMERHRKVSPHRSFYLTTHAKAVRQINISGYGRFVHEVGRLIWDNKWLYLKTLLLIALIIFIMVVSGSKDSYV